MADNGQKKLTPEQEAKIPAYREQWIGIAEGPQGAIDGIARAGAVDAR